MRRILLTLVLTVSICRASDPREDLIVTAHLGLAIESFAAPVQQNLLYGNPAGNGAKKERMVGGFRFAYRLSGDRAQDRRPQLWLFGESAYGQRSAELDCSNPGARPPLCGFPVTGVSVTGAAQPGRQLIYLLRNASSLEAHAGLRFEFLPLQSRGQHPARLYVKAQAGFLSLPGGAGDVFDAHHVALGALATGGSFQGSYFEAGWGRNDLFLTHRYRRAVADAFLTWGSPAMRARGVAAFAQMQVSGDLSSGADSVRTVLGITFDVGRLFGD